MAKRISTTRARAQLSELVGKVAHGGEHYLIERRGKPLAAIVSVSDLEQIETKHTTSVRPLGALALSGGWREIEDAEIDALIANIYEGREYDRL